MMWHYLFESGVWSATGLVVGYLVGHHLADIRTRLDRIEKLEENRSEEKE